ncbi:MAG: hypothetical protein R3B84_17940 [Zavarzinella sp.]
MLQTLLLTVVLAAPQEPAEINALIEKLGDPSFKVREAAEERLLEIGAEALDYVKAGIMHDDAEISTRCHRIYPEIRNRNLELLLDRFVVNVNNNAGDIPGASEFLKIVGDSKANRELYKSMFKKHELILSSLGNEDQNLRAFTDLAMSLRSVNQLGRPINNINNATDDDLHTYFFLGSITTKNRETAAGNYQFHYPLLSSPLLAELTKSESFNKLFVGWLKNERYSTLLNRGFAVAVQYKITGAKDAALHIVNDKNVRLAYIKSYALSGFARLATKEDLPKLDPLLQDKSILTNIRINNINGQVQVRDVALGAAMIIMGQNPNDFGYPRKLPNLSPTSTLSYTYFVMESDEKRDEALKKWQQWLKDNDKKQPEKK